MTNTILSFGAMCVNPEILEQTLTARLETVNEIERKFVEKSKSLSTYQSLIIAPRGSGKTHIVNVLYHRFKNNNEITEKIVTAFMSEDEVGIVNFTDLIISMLQSFIRYNEPNCDGLQKKIMEASLIKDINNREAAVQKILTDFTKGKIILLLIENFDKILQSLGNQGQSSLRDFIHQYNNLSIIATSQNLIVDLQDSKSSFYKFYKFFNLKN